MHGRHLLVQEVGRQTCVAIFSGESEFHALTLCAARLIFTKSLVGGFGFPRVDGPITYSDSSAARGIANRMCVGKLNHLQVRSLWLQPARAVGQVRVNSIDTLLNTADLGTKFLDAARRKQLIAMMPLREHERKHERVLGGRGTKDDQQRAGMDLASMCVERPCQRRSAAANGS